MGRHMAERSPRAPLMTNRQPHGYEPGGFHRHWTTSTGSNAHGINEMPQETQGGELKKRKRWQYTSSGERGAVQEGTWGSREAPTEVEGAGQPQPPAAAGAVTRTSRFQRRGPLIRQQRSRHVLPASTSLTAAGHANQREHNELLTRHRLKGSERSKVTYAPSPSKFLKRAISASVGTCHLCLLSPPPQS